MIKSNPKYEIFYALNTDSHLSRCKYIYHRALIAHYVLTHQPYSPLKCILYIFGVLLSYYCIYIGVIVIQLIQVDPHGILSFMSSTNTPFSFPKNHQSADKLGLIGGEQPPQYPQYPQYMPPPPPQQQQPAAGGQSALVDDGGAGGAGAGDVGLAGKADHGA